VKKIVILSYFLAFDAPVRGFPSEYRDPVWTKKTRMVSWCYKIVFGLVYVNLGDIFVFSPCQYTRGHKFKLYKRQTISCVCANFFSE